jgi:hypothetical protein
VSQSSEQSRAGAPVVLRYVIGVTLFIGFVVFVTPTELAILITPAKPGDPVGLAQFGVTCAAFLGPPGYFLFPYRRRFQAVAWLSLACMCYSLALFGLLTFMQMNLEMITSPDGREFIRGMTIHHDRLAVITALQLAVWALLFRKKRI